MKRKQKEILLGVLLAVMAIVAWWNLSVDTTGGRAPAARGGSGGRADITTLRVYPVQWASLSAPRPGYDPSGRNIFQFGVIAPPPPPPLTAAEKAAIEEAQRRAEEARRKAMEEEAARQKAVQEAMANATPTPPPPPPPPPRPQPPPINYKFIGYIGPSDHKIAVLHNGTDMIFARQGDEVEKGIKILEIGYESIKFGFTDPQFKGESRTLPMSSSY